VTALEIVERQRDALADALREAMMSCDHILLADASDIRDWRNDVLRMQDKLRALLAEVEKP
jgi:hypothetical protein